MADGINFVRALKPTPYGDIKVEWNLSKATFDIRLTIPPGTTGTLECPASLEAKVAEMPPTSLMRYGLIYNEKQRDRIDAPENEKFPATEPIQLQSGTYRIIYMLKGKN
jgi:hypothetical protein